MGAQDRTEKVLRDIHVLFSKAEPFEGSKQRVVVDKNEVMELLKEHNGCMYDMMEEYELTKRSRDKADRGAQKKRDDMAFEASRNAVDIYAASIMYTDNALARIGDIMKKATEEVEDIFHETEESLKKERQEIKSNQLDLKGQLQELIDTQKYLRLIEEENRRIASEKKKNEGEVEEPSPYAAIKPEIHINKEYFAQAGIPLEDGEDSQETEEDSRSETDLKRSAELSRELDEDYFQWKEQQEGSGEEPDHRGRGKGFSLVGKKW